MEAASSLIHERVVTSGAFLRVYSRCSHYRKSSCLASHGRGFLSLSSSRTHTNRSHTSRKRRPWCQAIETVDGGAEDNSETSLPVEGVSAASICSALASVFPLWVIAAAVLGSLKPHLFTWIKGNVMVAALAITMLGMGTTLSLEDFKGAVAMPKELFAGVVLQYTIMPAMGFLVAKFMRLPEHFAVGIILVSCCPGGTASNVVTYLARGNVALSVLMTAVSTVLATVMTPVLTSLLAGQFVQVDGAALFLSTIQVVLLPTLLGALANHLWPTTVRHLSPFSPLVAVLAVAALVGSAVATSLAGVQLATFGWYLLGAVATLHMGGFLGGFFLSRALGFEPATSRTVAIEVGMQNSVLGVLLASQHFSNPLTAAPCALSSVTHSVLGSLLAAFWRLQDDLAGSRKEGPNSQTRGEST